MIPLIKLREDLEFAKELEEMMDVLKGATASQFRSLQQRRKGFDDFKLRLDMFLSSLKIARISHPFLRKENNLPKAVVMIASDEGFVGGLNVAVVNAGLEQASSNDELIVMGERGARYLSEVQSSSFTVLTGIGDDITYKRAVAIRNLLIERFLSKKIGSVLISYPRFLSLTLQRAELTRLLPCGDIFGTKEKFITESAGFKEFLIEPSEFDVVDYLVKAWLMQQLYDIFWESKLSEYAARIIHLESSHEEVLSSRKKLLYDYFKHLHEKSDRTIREIFASRLHWQKEEEPV